MTATSEQATYSISVLVSDWLFIDAVLDNHIQSAIDGAVPNGLDEEDDVAADDWESEAEIEADELPPVAELGTSVRQAGWDQVPGWPRDAEGFQTWPAPGQTATMALTGPHWELVLVALRHYADIAESLSDAVEVAKSRALAAAVANQLAVTAYRAGS